MNNQDLRICFVGDSFVAGVNDPECLSWTGRLSALAHRRGYNLTQYNLLGIRRDTSADIAVRWQAEAACRLPDYCKPFVVFSFGVNDTTIETGGTRLEETQSIENTRHMLGAARKRYSVLLIGPPPIADAKQNKRTRRLSQLMSEAAAEEGVLLFPIFDALIEDPVWMARSECGRRRSSARGGIRGTDGAGRSVAGVVVQIK